MSWKDIIKQNKTMADLSDSDREKLLRIKEEYDKTITEYPEDYYTFQEMVDKLLSEGKSVDEIIDFIIKEIVEEEYLDEDDNQMEEMESRRERSADAYFSGGGYNTGVY